MVLSSVRVTMEYNYNTYHIYVPVFQAHVVG